VRLRSPVAAARTMIPVTNAAAPEDSKIS